ncbi:MAG: methyltransferase family protein, partial [Thermoguttaceae bacterium]
MSNKPAQKYAKINNQHKKMQTPLERIISVGNGYQAACLLMAGCELDLFSAILREPTPPTARMLAEKCKLNDRALTVLLDALVTIGFLTKENDTYKVEKGYETLLDSKHSDSFVQMINHYSSCQRAWSQLAWVVKSGI